MMFVLVPPASRLEAIPCRHIPLNECGETIDSFYRRRTQLDLEETVDAWLRTTIQQLEEGTEWPTAG